MLIQRLEELTKDPELLKRAKIALKTVHERNKRPRGSYPYPSPYEIENDVAMELSGNANLDDPDDHNDTLSRERRIFERLGIIDFLARNGFIVALSPISYYVPRDVERRCPQLYQ